MLRWFEESGANDDVVISIRILLPRNLAAYPFSPRITAEQADKMIHEAGRTLLKLPAMKPYHDYVLEDLDEIQKEALAERNVISRYLLKQNKAMFLAAEDEKSSIMLNEEEKHV